MKPIEIMTLAYQFVDEKHELTSKSMANFYKANGGDPEYVRYFVMDVEDRLRQELYNKLESCHLFIDEHFEESDDVE